MRFSKTRTTFAIAALGAVLLLASACNSGTDDPDVSQNILSVALVSPTTACVDYDGDGTAITNVLQNFTIQSRVRGTATGTSAVWNDAIIEAADISYTMTDGLGDIPAKRIGVTLTVKANNTGTTSVETVSVAYVAQYFNTPGREGQITLRFSGHDAGGEALQISPVTVPVASAGACVSESGK